MSAIVNARDVLLQAAATRLDAVSIPVNVIVPNAQVAGLGALATQNAVNLATQITGALANSNVTGLGALALLSSVNLSGATVVGDLAAARIGVGTLAAGVIYAGNLSASNITTGTLSGVTVNIAGNFIVDAVGSTIAKQIQGGNAQFNNGYTGGTTASSALTGTNTGSSAPGVYGYSSYTSGSGHGIRGQNANGSSGLVGPANGYDFYAEGSGTNYGPFTGSHDALIPIGDAVTVGQIVVDINVIERAGVSSTICEVALSSTANQPGVIGVAAISPRALSELLPNAFTDYAAGPDADGNPQPKASYSAACALYDHLAINAVGEGQLLCTDQGGDLAVGDLIVTSSTPGVGMKQADGVVRSYTVAKCREAVSFASGEVKAVACIYLCG